MANPTPADVPETSKTRSNITELLGVCTELWLFLSDFETHNAINKERKYLSE